MSTADDGVTLASYIKYQQESGSTVKTFTFDTTQAQENQILQNAENIGDQRGLTCAKSVSTAISGVGPFQKITPTIFPGNLANQLLNLPSNGGGYGGGGGDAVPKP